jgi:hypothetical protein
LRNKILSESPRRFFTGVSAGAVQYARRDSNNRLKDQATLQLGAGAAQNPAQVTPELARLIDAWPHLAADCQKDILARAGLINDSLAAESRQDAPQRA